MGNANIKTLYAEWQTAVAAHESLCRDAKTSGLSTAEIAELGRAYLLRIDAAYSRLKEAEANVAVRAQVV